MQTFLATRSCRWLLGVSGVGLLVWISHTVASGGTPQDANKTVWQYREMETPVTAVQAAMDDLGRDGWEVFNVYGAATVVNEGNAAKLVPHTFYVFAKRPVKQ